jgi:hypothetical protein
MNTIIDYINNNTLPELTNFTSRKLTEKEIEKFNEMSIVDIKNLNKGFISGSFCLNLLFGINCDDMDLYDGKNNIHELTQGNIFQYVYALNIINYIPKDEKKKTLQHIRINVNKPQEMALIVETYDMDICKSFIDLENKTIYIYNTEKGKIKYYDVFESAPRIIKYREKFPDYKFEETQYANIPIKKIDLYGIDTSKGYNGNTKKLSTKKTESDGEVAYKNESLKITTMIPELHDIKIQGLLEYIKGRVSRFIVKKKNDVYGVIDFKFKKILYTDYLVNTEQYEKSAIIIKTSIYDKFVTIFETINDFVKYYENARIDNKFVTFYEIIQKENISPFIDIDINKENLSNEIKVEDYIKDIKGSLSEFYKDSSLKIFLASSEGKNKISYHIYTKGISKSVSEIKEDIETISASVRFKNKNYNIKWVDMINYTVGRLFRIPYSVKEKEKDPEYPRVLMPESEDIKNYIIKQPFTEKPKIKKNNTKTRRKILKKEEASEEESDEN